MIRALLHRWAGTGRAPREGGLPAGWAPAARGRLHLHAALAHVPALAERFPGRVASTIDAAERLLAHEFDLLGSGRFVPRDPDRQAIGGYTPIDWRLDPRSGTRFPAGFSSATWTAAMCPAGADIKLPWELARAQHFATLAQAWVFTGDERFRREVVLQCGDFLAANPVGEGVQWICTMDVALRAVSWALAFDVLAPEEPDGEWERLYAFLWAHGRFVRSHLENTYEVTSNHFLSNVAGLMFLGVVFRGTREGDEWREFARASLEHEIAVQVLPDGADFESSVPYNRLVAELFLTSLRAADLGGVAMSAAYRSRVAAAIEFHHALLRPDGRMPQVGDADDGRAHVFSGWGHLDPQAGLHLLGPAAAMFGNATWREALDETARWEAAWWGVAPDGRQGSGLADGDRLFPDAGIAVARRRGSYLLVSNGKVGTNGFGNHKHNDQLSFELHVDGRPLIVDPGSYVYTGDPAARNAFRSTAGHNTLRIDGAEQHEMNPEWLFRTFAAGEPRHLAFEAGARHVVYRGSFDGYRRLPKPVLHERAFEFDTAAGALAIEDVLTGEGEHHLEWRFHCAPGVRATPGTSGVVLRDGGRAFVLEYPRHATVAVGDGWYSPSYGVRTPAMVVTVSEQATMSAGAPVRRAFRLAAAGEDSRP